MTPQESCVSWSQSTTVTPNNQKQFITSLYRLQNVDRQVNLETLLGNEVMTDIVRRHRSAARSRGGSLRQDT
jgi:hypothetical protein